MNLSSPNWNDSSTSWLRNDQIMYSASFYGPNAVQNSAINIKIHPPQNCPHRSANNNLVYSADDRKEPCNHSSGLLILWLIESFVCENLIMTPLPVEWSWQQFNPILHLNNLNRRDSNPFMFLHYQLEWLPSNVISYKTPVLPRSWESRTISKTVTLTKLSLNFFKI